MLWDFGSFGDTDAVIYNSSTKLTYKKLYLEGEDLAKIIGERCLVFLLCSNTIGSVLGYTAFMNHNIVPVMLPDNVEKDNFDFLMKQYEPSFIWLPDEMMNYINQADLVYKNYGYSLYRILKNLKYPLNAELGILMTTSGSTGSPKFVRQSYHNVLSNAQAIIKYLELSNRERPITTLPMNYTYGLSIINSHLFIGATIIMTDKSITQKEFWGILIDNNATSFGGVPYTYEILNKLNFTKMKFPTLKTMTQAGGKLSLELHKKFAEYADINCIKLYIMYGQTEATARMSYLPYQNSVNKCGSIGIAIPGGRLYLIDTNGEEINDSNVIGELVYEGPNVTMGYADSKYDLVKGDELKGTLITGDMAKRDEDGYYYIVGRKKRFIKIFGNRISLDEIERIIQDKFSNIECACAGDDDNLFLFIEDASLQEPIRKYLCSKTGIYHQAIHVRVIDRIPRSDSGKVSYQELSMY